MATVDKLPMLAEGQATLIETLRRLKEEERPQVVEAIEVARAHGDLSENAEYHAAKERQGQIEAQLIELEDRLARAVVIDPTDAVGRQGRFSAAPSHLLDEDDKKVVYQIVGQTEADARRGRISYSSPLGRALIGRKVGEEVEVSTPSGDKILYHRKPGVHLISILPGDGEGGTARLLQARGEGTKYLSIVQEGARGFLSLRPMLCGRRREPSPKPSLEGGRVAERPLQHRPGGRRSPSPCPGGSG